MPSEKNIHILDQTRFQQVFLTAADFLSGRAVDADCAFGAGPLEKVRHCDGSGDRARSDQIVSACMSWSSSRNGLAYREGFLRQGGESVLFRPERDHRAPAAVAGYKCCRHRT